MEQVKKKRLSPFSKEFWIAKGFSEDEAEYKRNSIRPIRKEYWIEKGFSEDEAVLKAELTKKQNNAKGAKKSSERSKKEIYESSIRRIEYWIKRGYSKEEAETEVKKVQALGSLENFISRYGIIEGNKKWKDRQVKWQNTLNKKSEKEKLDINSRKNAIKLEYYNDVDSCIEELSKTRNMRLVKDIESLKAKILQDATENPYLLYIPYELFVEKRIPKIQIQILTELGYNIEDIRPIFTKSEEFLMKSGNKQALRRWTKEGLLRSSYEIYFYDRLKSEFPNTQFLIDGLYPGSNMRYDFYIFGEYIEICPLMETDIKYREKMLKKEKLFSCKLLVSVDDMEKYLEEKKIIWN